MGIDAAVARRARVIDVPIALARSSPALAAAVRDAGRHGALVIAPAYASGSAVTGSGNAPAAAAYPAALPDVLAVAALGPGGVPDQKLAPRTAPDLAAPGNAVMSVGPGGTGSFTGDGAELATAFIAGAAALALSAHPDLTPSQLSDRLTATAYHLPADKALVGAGTVDPAAAVTAPAPDPSADPSPWDPAALRMPPPEAHSGRTTAIAITSAAGGGRPDHGLRRVHLPPGPPSGLAARRIGAVGGTGTGHGPGCRAVRGPAPRPALSRQEA
ncbi:S8 family serine peptidase [Streptomyces sp. NPDC001890]|uniref:S8 family serine peptidase n=1 Tax=Streptomyces sp. NPDC001890 TaxID=3364620 RepID=UPI0036CC7307